LILKQLDLNILKEWENEQDYSHFPTLSEFFDFLKNKTKTFETISRISPQNASSNDKLTSTNPTQSRVQPSKSTNAACVHCHKGNHTVSKCNKFLNLSVNARWDAVIKQSICRRYLSPLQSDHNYNCNMSCKHCGKHHHDLLHKDFTRNGQNLTALIRSRANNKVTCSSASSILNNCILPTAKVKLSSTTRCLQTTALLDSGSNCNLITKNLAKRLKLKGCFRKIYVQGASGMSQASRSNC
jgi:hypothetical protein